MDIQPSLIYMLNKIKNYVDAQPGHSDVSRIIAGANININSTGPNGTGNVTINSTGGGGGTANSRIYLSGSGNDANDGLTQATAVKTFQRAFYACESNAIYDLEIIGGPAPIYLAQDDEDRSGIVIIHRDLRIHHSDSITILCESETGLELALAIVDSDVTINAEVDMDAPEIPRFIFASTIDREISLLQMVLSSLKSNYSLEFAPDIFSDKASNSIIELFNSRIETATLNITQVNPVDLANPGGAAITLNAGFIDATESINLTNLNYSFSPGGNSGLLFTQQFNNNNVADITIPQDINGFKPEPFWIGDESYNMVYVSNVTGNDDYSGYSVDSPVKTLQRALEICESYNIKDITALDLDQPASKIRLLEDQPINTGIHYVIVSHDVVIHHDYALDFSNLNTSQNQVVLQVNANATLKFEGHGSVIYHAENSQQETPLQLTSGSLICDNNFQVLRYHRPPFPPNNVVSVSTGGYLEVGMLIIDGVLTTPGEQDSALLITEGQVVARRGVLINNLAYIGRNSPYKGLLFTTGINAVNVGDTSIPTSWNGFKPEPFWTDPDYLVYVSDTGDDANDGLTPDTPVVSLFRAYQICEDVQRNKSTYTIMAKSSGPLISYTNTLNPNFSFNHDTKIVIYDQTTPLQINMILDDGTDTSFELHNCTVEFDNNGNSTFVSLLAGDEKTKSFIHLDNSTLKYNGQLRVRATAGSSSTAPALVYIGNNAILELGVLQIQHNLPTVGTAIHLYGGKIDITQRIEVSEIHNLFDTGGRGLYEVGNSIIYDVANIVYPRDINGFNPLPFHLPEDIEVYVSSTGNDANDGLTPSTAVLSLHKGYLTAINYEVNKINISGEVPFNLVDDSAEVTWSENMTIINDTLTPQAKVRMISVGNVNCTWRLLNCKVTIEQENHRFTLFDSHNNRTNPYLHLVDSIFEWDSYLIIEDDGLTSDYGYEFDLLLLEVGSVMEGENLEIYSLNTLTELTQGPCLGRIDQSTVRASGIVYLTHLYRFLNMSSRGSFFAGWIEANQVLNQGRPANVDGAWPGQWL